MQNIKERFVRVLHCSVRDEIAQFGQLTIYRL